ncbi:MAG: protein phosphatase 2C domain-containing protein [Crocosphaera sp.]|nr:protein phosphatase 2C domain-containing protein [Crocosphaera sp.]
MTESMATIQCSNPECQTANPLENKVCEQCGTPLLKQYLRPLGDWVNAFNEGQFIDKRYLLKSNQVILDTLPGVPPEFTEDIPEKIRKYLRLFPYRCHLPQIYTYYSLPRSEAESLDIGFLEYGTIPLDESGEPVHAELLPRFVDVWPQTKDNPLKQLNWLWQMAKLWQPLEGQQMVSSLLDPSLVRVNGGVVQLLDLHLDEHNFHSVKELGQLWLSLIEGTSPLIVEYLETLCDYLQRGKIPHPDYLLTYFEPALNLCGEWYEKKYQVFTLTDTGPTRPHNEDACYPSAGKLVESSDNQLCFTIVCDGVGGQDGGEIASQLAIDTLVEEMPKLSLHTTTEKAQQCLEELAAVINLTNDRISERNDSENRRDRQRMGTTLVFTLVHNHEVYLGNVGDSRIYRITPESCQQVTTDDDLASREVRLGYLFYREAIKYPNSGALVQALGMSNANQLHPNVSHFITDEDCIFLLCSDGLSDYDRVDQYWKLEIVPILAKEKDLETVGKELIKTANTQNGHDNVTIALLYCQIQLKSLELTPLSIATVEASLNLSQEATESTLESIEMADDIPSDMQPTEPFPSVEENLSANNNKLWLILIIVGILVVVFGLGAYGILNLLKPTPLPSPLPSASVTPVPPPSPTKALPPSGTLIQLTSVLKVSAIGEEKDLLSNLPPDSILEILDSKEDVAGIRVKICQIPAESSSDRELEGNEILITTPDLEPSMYQTYEGEEVGSCRE